MKDHKLQNIAEILALLPKQFPQAKEKVKTLPKLPSRLSVPQRPTTAMRPMSARKTTVKTSQAPVPKSEKPATQIIKKTGAEGDLNADEKAKNDNQRISNVKILPSDVRCNRIRSHKTIRLQKQIPYWR